MVRKEAPLDVRIPTPAEDRPVLSRVGIVAILGFALGVAWPKLVGVELGPDAPGSRAKETAAAAAPAQPAPSTTAAAEAASSDDDGAAEANKRTNEQRAVLASLNVARCRDAKGKKREGKGESGCAPLAADRWIEPRLKSLASCPAAIGLEGDMELELDVDFEKKSIRVDQGAKSEFPTSTVRGVLTCAGDELESLELDKIPHTQPRVTLLARVRFVPPGKALEPVAPDEKDGAAEGDAEGDEAGLGTATVTWEKALLRDAPKDGKVVARVPQGSRLKLLEHRDDWYLVTRPRGDDKGWVYRQAIGK